MCKSGFSWLSGLLFVARLCAMPIDSPLLSSYDYIVVGGGPSGLTVANRLSENPNVTVLVLEAGQADLGEARFQIPVRVGDAIPEGYNWDLSTVPQTYLDGKSRFYPLGKGVGGGTLINGMLWNRGGQGDFDDWVSLGNQGWGWKNLLHYFKKSETYTPVASDTQAHRYSIHYDPALHGFHGPVNVSYQRYFYKPSAHFFRALNQLGIPTAYDPQNGSVAGAMYLPFDVDPVNQTRADARVSYFDPYILRPNFYVSTKQQVTQLIFEDTGCSNPNASIPKFEPIPKPKTFGRFRLFGIFPFKSSPTRTADTAFPFMKRRGPTNPTIKRIIGVQYARTISSTRKIITARREVILAAGAIHTPQLLELSGIGSADILKMHNITMVIDLPGVGNNMQDHPLVGTNYPYQNASFIYPTELRTNASFNTLAKQEYLANRTGPWTTGPPDGVAFPSLPDLTNRSDNIIATAKSQTPQEFLAAGLDPTVVAGYTAQFPLLIAALRSHKRAAYELLNWNTGMITVANMRPFVRGSTHIRSSEPFDYPSIDPRYGSNPVDLHVLREGLKFNRRLLATPQMAIFNPYPWIPSPNATDSQLFQYIKSGIQTEYHPSGTCSMLPRNLGGVVDSNLLVYGTSNLRIVDASIYPLVPAAHLQAVVYAVAEKAADIIRASAPPATPVHLPGGSCTIST